MSRPASGGARKILALAACLLVSIGCRTIPGQDVRYQPTPMPVVRAMLELADVGPEDLGGRQADHGLCPWYDRPMDEIAVSRFKATCLAALERVRRTRRPLRVTRFGKPLADIVPPASPPVSASWLGSMRYRGRIVGDIVAPVEPEEAWGAEE